MIKHYLLILISLLVLTPVFAQDQIAKVDGKLLNCDIISIDSSVIKFNYHNGNMNVNTYIDKEKVLFYKF